MRELELLKKLHGTYKRYCDTCEEAKHLSKFRRFSKVRKTCNECFNKKLRKENERT